PDVVLGKLLRKRLGQGDAGGPGDVGGERLGAGIFAADGRDVHDAAAAPAHHPRDDQTAESDGREQLEVEVFENALVGLLKEGSPDRRAGVVHQDVNAAEGVHGGVHHPLDVLGTGDVGGNG